MCEGDTETFVRSGKDAGLCQKDVKGANLSPEAAPQAEGKLDPQGRVDNTALHAVSNQAHHTQKQFFCVSLDVWLNPSLPLWLFQLF